MDYKRRIFEDLNCLFNPPDDTYNLYCELKKRIGIDSRYPIRKSVLQIFIYGFEAKESMKDEMKYIHLNSEKLDKYTIKTVDGDIYCYASIDDIRDRKFLIGRRFTEIRFVE